ncbi:Manganese transporter smf1 [Sorochytrium milnesiophthora]
MAPNVNAYVRGFLKTLAFVGPGFLVSVGYMDPGNWATDLAAGSKLGYSLLFVILLSNVFALVMQYLCIKLGVVTGMDLAQACRHYYSRRVAIALWLLTEVTMVATDLAEVIGSAIALNILFKIPILWAVVITGVDVILVLMLYRSEGGLRSARFFEMIIMVLVLSVTFCFVAEIAYAKPNARDVFLGFIPTSELFKGNAAYLSIGIIGATLMPHNLYLHSHAVKVRAAPGANVVTKISSAIKYSFIDCFSALTIALFVNAAILIVSAANFFYGQQKTDVADLYDAYNLLAQTPGPAAATVFAVALLLSGQSSSITATLAGSVVMEGFVQIRIRPWLRRLITRLAALVPAIVVVMVKGANGLNDLLVLSQVLLSIQLPFAIVPLIYFTSQTSVMTRPGDIAEDELLPPSSAPSSSSTAVPAGRKSRTSSVAGAQHVVNMPRASVDSVGIQVDLDSLERDDEPVATTRTSLSPEEQAARRPAVNFVNGWTLTIASSSIALFLIIMNVIVLIQTARGQN